MKAYLKRLTRYPLRYLADECMACSESAAEYMFGRARKVRRIANAIDGRKYQYSEELRRKLRTEWGLEDCFVIGHIGNFTKAKNYPFLLEVFHHVHQKEARARLLLVGKKENAPHLPEKVAELQLTEAVIFTGVRKDVPELLMAMDVFVFPSRFEGIPVALLEAQASGIPCVVADTVAKEAMFTELIEFLPLGAGPEYWAMKVLSVTGGKARENQYENLCHAGYDIVKAAEEMEEYYFTKYDSR